MKIVKLSLAVAMVALSAVAARAAELPKELAARYDGLTKAIRTCDTKSFDGFFAKDFVNVDPAGKKTPRAEFLKGVGEMFQGAKSCDTKVTFSKVAKQSDTTAVDFDFSFTVKGKLGGDLLAHEVGTDYWKKTGGKWMLVKTVDKTMDVKPVAKAKGSAKAKK